MAHVGKLGPVHFRRDFNLNVNNNQAGWYRRYLARLGDLPPGSANIVNGFTFDCAGIAPSIYRELAWQSPFVAVPVFQFQLKLIIQINDLKTFFKGFELHQKGAGIILACQWSHDDNSFFPKFPQNVGLVTEFYNTDWFDEEPNNVVCNAVGKFWTDGPPLD